MKKVLIFIFSILVLFLVFNRIFSSTDRAFDKDFWISNPDKRYLMSKDIIESNLLIGKDKKYVIELLTDECKHCSNLDDSWMYYTKVEKGWRDHQIEILDIVFIDGYVNEVSIRDFR